jgi:hypothetical protein
MAVGTLILSILFGGVESHLYWVSCVCDLVLSHEQRLETELDPVLPKQMRMNANAITELD